MKVLILDNPVISYFEWVEGHLLQKKGLPNCTPPEIMNNLVHRLADAEFHCSLSTNRFIENEFPFERFWVWIGGKKITGSLRQEIDNLTGNQVACEYLAKSGWISTDNFPKVWWDGMETLMKSYPKMYRVWLTKHVLGFCGTNKLMLYWKKNWSVLCSFCSAVVERA